MKWIIYANSEDAKLPELYLANKRVENKTWTENIKNAFLFNGKPSKDYIQTLVKPENYSEIKSIQYSFYDGI